MNPTKQAIIGIVVVFLVVSGVVWYKNARPAQQVSLPVEDGNTTKKTEIAKVVSQTGEYNPVINPSDFTTNITNKYFSLPVGKKMYFDADTEEGPEKIQIEITGETRVIEGVTTLVYLDTVWKDGQVVEITKDYLAQHKTTGDVWYFGEDVDNYEDGKLKDHEGSFIHGRDGAKAGIWMKAEQKVGDSYKQEYYRGEAEDMRDTVATGLTVTTNLGTFTDCVKVYDWTPLDKESREHKTYCPEVGSLVLNEHLETGKRSELTKVINP